jgi:flagellar basal-body rod protein FlgG
MSAQMARQDVLANNLANVSTTAFKPDVLAIRQRDPVRKEDGVRWLPSNDLIERLGAGVMPVATRVNTSSAPIEKTNRPMDMAIDGEGFFVVRAGPGPEGLRLTRDGRFTLARDGTLVTSTDGRPVLGEGDQPIRLDPTLPFNVHSDGTVAQPGGGSGQISLVSVADPSRLIKAGGGLLRVPEGQTIDRRGASGLIVQGALETSGVNAIDAMVDVTGVSRAVESNATIIGYINDMMGRAISGLGRVA